MPRTPITITPVIMGGIAPNQITLDPTNGHVVSVTRTRKMLIHVRNTTTSAKIVTFKSGSLAPSQRSGLGDLAVSIPASVERMFILESARHVQADGTINIDVESGMTGTVTAAILPQNG